MYSYSPYFVALSSNGNLRTLHAVLTKVTVMLVYRRTYCYTTSERCASNTAGVIQSVRDNANVRNKYLWLCDQVMNFWIG
jgi:hypothetical protein